MCYCDTRLLRLKRVDGTRFNDRLVSDLKNYLIHNSFLGWRLCLQRRERRQKICFAEKLKRFSNPVLRMLLHFVRNIKVQLLDWLVSLLSMYAKQLSNIY